MIENGVRSKEIKPQLQFQPQNRTLTKRLIPLQFEFEVEVLNLLVKAIFLRLIYSSNNSCKDLGRLVFIPK